MPSCDSQARWNPQACWQASTCSVQDALTSFECRLYNNECALINCCWGRSLDWSLVVQMYAYVHSNF